MARTSSDPQSPTTIQYRRSHVERRTMVSVVEALGRIALQLAYDQLGEPEPGFVLRQIVSCRLLDRGADLRADLTILDADAALHEKRSPRDLDLDHGELGDVRLGAHTRERRGAGHTF